MKRTVRISALLVTVLMLLSLCGNVEVCQIVDPMKTARFVVPKYVLAGLGFAW